MSYAGPASRGKRVRHLEIDSARAADAASARARRPPAEVAQAPAIPRSRHGSAGRTSSWRAERSWASPALFASGVALGIALGAGGALLLAPQSGEETRLELSRSARRLGRRGHDVWEDLREELRRARRRRKSARRRAREERDLDD